ncbi:MAG: type I-C CRISPR-associated protein Cas8c/Csd1 [Bacteroidota bacterium]
MIQELVELAGKIKKIQSNVGTTHDAFGIVQTSIDCVIDRKGNFKQFIVHEKQPTIAERLTSKKGSARLLVDKSEEVLEFVNEKEKNWEKLEKQRKQAPYKHKLFLEKLKEYEGIKGLSPVFLFFDKNRKNGLRRAQKEFKAIDEKERQGNIAFLLSRESKRIHEQQAIIDAVIEHHAAFLAKEKNNRFERCSICGSSSHPIADIPHGMIAGRWVPAGQKNGCALVSYNFPASESYGFKGNQNSSICTKCAKAYVEALNWLLAPYSWIQNENKGKPRPVFKNRKDISNDTAVVYWLKKKLNVEDISQLDEPDEEKIRKMIDSIYEGRVKATRHIITDMFYAITLSGAAARIAIRDWIETSVENLRVNIAHWFRDIEIYEYNSDEKKLIHKYPRFWEMVRATKSKSGKDVEYGRIGTALWKSAVLGTDPPLWILSAVFNRIRAEQGNVTSTRIALLKFCLNRKTNNKGGKIYMATLDESNKNIAYTCGRLFAVLESIQYHASGGNLNAGIRERFFSFASAMPATAFGRLMKLSQHHLSKIRGDKPGLAVNLDKKLQELIGKIEGFRFPAVFSLEDQASFAIGYYHQRQNDFINKSDKEK